MPQGDTQPGANGANVSDLATCRQQRARRIRAQRQGDVDQLRRALLGPSPGFWLTEYAIRWQKDPLRLACALLDLAESGELAVALPHQGRVHHPFVEGEAV